MTRQEAFEAHWADVHDLPVETMQQYRFASQDGYRLPGIAAAYRNFCAGWDARDDEAKAQLDDLRLEAQADACRAEYWQGEQS
jgi:hypothetical protein